MAIKNITSVSPNPPPSSDALTFSFDNGDRNVLELIKNKWKFKDEESLLRFALAVLVKAEGNSVSVKNESGGEINLKPSDDLLLKV
jgi:hypothetical protein